MITIDKPWIENTDTDSYLKARVFISDDTSKEYIRCSRQMYYAHWRTHKDYPPKYWTENDYCMWFKVPKEYGKYLVTETCDAFLVAIIYYAMLTGSDITCNAPVSTKLYYGLTQHLIPLLCRDRRIIAIRAKDLDSNNYSIANKNGTGMSCGVDSFYTLYRYTREDIPSDYKLNALTYLNMGAIFHPNREENTDYEIKEFYEITDRMSDEKFANALKVGQEAGMPVIYISSNLDIDFCRGGYAYNPIYRNAACILSLEKYFGKYYSSSAGWPTVFEPTLFEDDERYATLLLSSISTDSVQFILSDEVTRYDKTTSLVDFDLAKRYLDVCFCFNNCGCCSKCYRTLITLDLLDSVDEFSECFDVEEYKKNRLKAYNWLTRTSSRLTKQKRKEDDTLFADEILEKAIEKGTVPLKCWLTLPLFRVFCILKQIRKKIFR